MGLQKLIKNFLTKRRRKRLAKDMASGKVARGRVAVVAVPGIGSIVASKIKMRGSISARIIRKDGTVEELGVISDNIKLA